MIKREIINGKSWQTGTDCLIIDQLFSKQQNFRPVQIKRICRRQNKCDSKIEIYCIKGRKHCRKRGKCWLPAFSSFPTMFSKGFLYRVIKSRDCMVKG